MGGFGRAVAWRNEIASGFRLIDVVDALPPVPVLPGLESRNLGDCVDVVEVTAGMVEFGVVLGVVEIVVASLRLFEVCIGPLFAVWSRKK